MTCVCGKIRDEVWKDEVKEKKEGNPGHSP